MVTFDPVFFSVVNSTFLCQLFKKSKKVSACSDVFNIQKLSATYLVLIALLFELTNVVHDDP